MHHCSLSQNKLPIPCVHVNTTYTYIFGSHGKILLEYFRIFMCMLKEILLIPLADFMLYFWYVGWYILELLKALFVICAFWIHMRKALKEWNLNLGKTGRGELEKSSESHLLKLGEQVHCSNMHFYVCMNSFITPLTSFYFIIFSLF